MGLDPRYVTDGPLQEYFVSKDSGLPLSGGTLTFFRDSSRITPKTVYELTGSPPNYSYVALPNPITLSAVGTPMNGSGEDIVIYYFPFLPDGVTEDLYYVVVQDSNGVDQFTREAWPNAAIENPSPSPSSSLPVQNQISNPQFSQILINDIPTLSPSSTVFSVNGSNLEFEVAPDWTLIASSSVPDTVVVERIAIAGSTKAATNPPYSLAVTTGINITFCILRQRFNQNSGLWTSTANSPVFLSSGIVIKNRINAPTTVSMYYQASSGTLATPFLLLSQAVGPSADYAYYTGESIQVPQSDDGLSGESGFIDIYIKFSPASFVEVTSIQVVPSINVTEAPVLAYDLASSNRDEALMGDYYLPRVTTSPIPSILTGWDFPLNPFQFGSTATVNFGTPAYICDQTICCVSAGSVAISRNSATGGLVIDPTGHNNQACYILQYLSGAQVQDILFNRLSSNISAWLGAGGGNVSVAVYLYAAPSAGTIPVLPLTLVAISSAGVISSLASGWNAIPRSGLDIPRAALSISNPTIDNDIRFTGWEITDPTQLTNTVNFGMVVAFNWDTATVININSISLQKGDLPTRPAAQTFSDVLNECQHYYEKSYDPSVEPETATGNGALLVQQFVNVSGSTYLGRSFPLSYKTVKRVAPTVTLYSPDGTPANVQTVINNPSVGQTNANIVAETYFTQSGQGREGCYYMYSNAAVINGATWSGFRELYVLFHFVADARLGVV